MKTSQTWELYQTTTQVHTFDLNSVEDLASRGDLNSLIEKKLQPRELNQRDRFGFTPLMIAAYAQRGDVVKYLLELGADPNVADFGGNTVLMGVTFLGNVELARLLLQYRADLDHHNLRGLNVRDLAVMFDQKEILRLVDRYIEAKSWGQSYSVLELYKGPNGKRMAS